MTERGMNIFSDLYMPLHNSALRYCKALTAGNPGLEARELLQQSLHIAIENFGKLRDEEKFRFWLFKIITRAFYAYSGKYFWKRFSAIDSQKEYSGYSAFPEFIEDESRDENKSVLLWALSRIKKKDRSAFILYAVEDFSLEEIKKVQNELSVSTVKSRIYRTRKKLAELIMKYRNNETAVKAGAEKDNVKLIAEIENEIFR